jgi:hypothetical protein
MAVENEELNEDSLFDQAVEETPADPPAPEPQPEPEPEPQPEPEAQLTPEPAKAAVDDNAPLVPSWRLREINEEKRTLADRLAALEAEKATWQRQPQVQQPAAVEKAAKPDPLLDPDGYAKAVRDEIREEIISERRESSLHAAHGKYKTEFEEAYAAAQKAVDPALKARMQASRDPGETLVQWHRENKVKAEVGSDPNAWLEKKLEERLKDPAFLAKAVELARGSAQPQQQNGRPRVDLPPSLNGASRSNAALRASQTDLSDDALWDEATA